MILGSGGNEPDFTDINHFFETWFGRPCCVVCTWNPGFCNPPDYQEETGKLISGGGYADEYPSDVWRNHVVTKHKDLLSGKAFKSWAKERGGYVAKAAYRVKASQLDVKV